MYLKTSKLTDLSADGDLNFILPLGSTEQHGPFLPFNTDTIIVEEVVKRIEKKIPEIIVLPTIEVTHSPEHEGFYGSLWISRETLFRILDDIYNSLEGRVGTIFILNWHGGNRKPLLDYLMANKSKKYINIELSDDEIDKRTEQLIKGPVDDHAGNTETSMVQAANVGVEINESHLKETIEKPFSTGKLIDKSKDGIADRHPKWVYGKDLGDEFIEMSVNKVLREINSCL